MTIPGGEAVRKSTRGTMKDPYFWTSNYITQSMPASMLNASKAGYEDPQHTWLNSLMISSSPIWPTEFSFGWR
jgi:hypothetical protein